jgi:AcrR family transcriptional regulator
MKRSVSYLRARGPDQKAERSEAILEIAEQWIQREPFDAINMGDLARRLGLAKGTLYLYYATKEALFLAVLWRVFGRFFDRAEAALRAQPRTRSGVSDALLGALAATPSLRHLTAILHSVLEHNVSDEEVAAFKHFLRRRVGVLGTLIDQRLRWPAGSGATLLLRFHVLLIGLHHVSNPSPAVERALSDEALGLFRIDFDGQLAEMLALLLQPTPKEQ